MQYLELPCYARRSVSALRQGACVGVDGVLLVPRTAPYITTCGDSQFWVAEEWYRVTAHGPRQCRPERLRRHNAEVNITTSVTSFSWRPRRQSQQYR